MIACCAFLFPAKFLYRTIPAMRSEHLTSCKSAMSRSCVVASGLKNCDGSHVMVAHTSAKYETSHGSTFHSFCVAFQVIPSAVALDKLRKTFIPKKDVRCVVPQFCGHTGTARVIRRLIS